MPKAVSKIVREDFHLPNVPKNIRESAIADYLEQLNEGLVKAIREITVALNQNYFSRYGDNFQGIMQFSAAEGEIRLPVYNGDPASPVNGEIWYSTATNTFRRRRNGVTESW